VGYPGGMQTFGNIVSILFFVAILFLAFSEKLVFGSKSRPTKKAQPKLGPPE